MCKCIQINDSLQFPVLGFGTYKLQNSECERAVYDALNNGIRLIDTASMYQNEQFVGNAIRKSIDEKVLRREDVFIITKLWPSAYTREKAYKSFFESLEKLQTEYIDMYLLHNSIGNIYEAWEVIVDLYERKLIKALGVSNFTNAKITEFIHFTNIKPMLNQIEIHPFYNQEKSVTYLRSINCIPQAWAPFAEGKNDIFNNKILYFLSNKYHKTIAQIILRWLFQREIPVVFRTKTIEHLSENCSIWDFSLSKEDMALINNLTLPNGNIIDYDDPFTIRTILNKRV